MQKITKAIIPAGGYGTRFLPASKAIPKEMFPIIDIPTIQLIAQEAVKSGILDIMIVLGKQKKAIEDHFDELFEINSFLEERGKEDILKELKRVSNLANFFYVRQKEMRGSGDAVLSCKSFIGKDPFAVLYGDDVIDGGVPCLKQLIDVSNKLNCSSIAVENVDKADAKKYGIIEPKMVLDENVCYLKNIIEKPQGEILPSTLAVVGRFVFESSIFDELEKIPLHGKETYLTDAIVNLSGPGHVACVNFEGSRFDIGDKLGYLKCILHYASKDGKLLSELQPFLNTLIQKK